MNNKSFILCGLFFLFIVMQIFAFGGREKKQPEKKIVQITGIVRLVGNEPFSELVITGSLSGDDNSTFTWYIINDERSKLNNLQHQTVTVEGEETVSELTFANGRPAGTRRELKNIRIISIGLTEF